MKPFCTINVPLKFRRVLFLFAAVLSVWGYFTEINPVLADEPVGNSSGLTEAQSTSVDTFTKDSTSKLIYGADDRKDEYQVSDANLLAAGDSTVAIVWISDLTDNENGTFSLSSQTLADWYNCPSCTPLCDSEPFQDQPNPAFCSGFLVAPDVVATAGHCVYEWECGKVAFVFGFVMTDPETAKLTIDASEIYFCSEILASKEGFSDWALIRLDRSVTGHTPLTIRSSGKVADNAPLVVIGHPMGLPRKYSGGASVYDNSPIPHFLANLDTYSGNSGSAVLNTVDYTVEGILVAGQVDWQYNPALYCDYSNICPDSGCPGWETVTRTKQFSKRIHNKRCKNTIRKAASKLATSIMTCFIDNTRNAGEFAWESCLEEAKKDFEATWAGSQAKAISQKKLCCNDQMSDVEDQVVPLAEKICGGIAEGIELQDKDARDLAVRLMKAAKNHCTRLVRSAIQSGGTSVAAGNDRFEKEWTHALETAKGVAYSGINMEDVDSLLNTLSSVVASVE